MSELFDFRTGAIMNAYFDRDSLADALRDGAEAFKLRQGSVEMLDR